MSHSAPVQHSRASNAQVQVAQVAQGQNCSRIDVIFAVVFAVPLMWFNCLLKFVLKLSPYSHLCPAFTPQAFPRASTQINSYLRGSGCVDESFKLGRLWTTTRACTRTRTQTSPWTFTQAFTQLCIMQATAKNVPRREHTVNGSPMTGPTATRVARRVKRGLEESTHTSSGRSCVP